MPMDNSFQMGMDAEKRFVGIMKKNGHKIAKSTSKQDMFEHWDYLVNGKVKAEVKGLKKARRSDNSTKNDWIYVEFRNVKGEDGWLYGKADVVCFEQEEGFLVVNRSSLVELAETLVKTTFTDRPTPYKSYKRRNRPDEHVGVIMVSDLLTIGHKVIT